MVGVDIFWWTAVLILGYMSMWYGLAMYLKRNDIADTAWGLGFVVVTLFNLIINPNLKLLIALGLVGVWGGRLAIHIWNRNKNKKEDFRYKKFEDNPFVKVFLTQGFFMWLIAWPIMGAGRGFGIVNLLGIVVWQVGFYFEAVGDWQLKEFLKNPKNKGKVMDKGLWAYTRHPNYFGEVTMWWGIFLLTWSGNFLMVIGPLTITMLILRVSGIPMLEKKYDDNKEYQDYKKRVPAFFPWKKR